jgi:cathepsin D
VDGTLGLAFPSISKLGAEPLFGSLVRQNRVMVPTFSLKLTHPGAELYLGGANSELYTGEITYARVTTRVSYNGRWVWMTLTLLFM